MFSAQDQHFCQFRTEFTTFGRFSAKFKSLYKTVFLARDQHGLAFLHWVRHFLAIFVKVHEFLQNSVFSPRSARFVVSALGAPMLSDCQQSARVCTKHCFQPKISTFSQFRTGRILLQRLSAKCTSLYKTEFQARLRHVFSLPHWAHHF